MAEFSNLGKHCEVLDCNLLDFLPFDCDGCGKTYCKNHKAKDNHECDQSIITVNRLKYKGPKSIPCFLEGCTNRELTPISCIKCRNCFCLQHRHAQDHHCKVLEAEFSNLESKTAAHIKDILASMQPPPKKTIKKGSKAAKTEAKVALMKMKMKAAGDKSIPDTEKIYLHIFLPLKSPAKSKNIFFSKKWTIGRVIDYIASNAGLTNNNNTGSDEKLRLFNGNEGELLETETLLESVIENEECNVYNGSSVILEYVPKSCTCLNDISVYSDS